MSRATLRRQMFHKNLDMLIHTSTMQSLEEEPGREAGLTGSQSNHDSSDSTNGDWETARSTMSNHDSIDSTNGDWETARSTMVRTPIYRPSKLNNGASDVALLKDFTMETSDIKVFDCPRPGTPYTEIDYSKVDYSKVGQKRKRSITPLVFQFPSTTSPNDSSPPFSPIYRDGSSIRRGSRDASSSRRTSIWDPHSCRTCHELDDDIPALPMSPAAFLQTSTPAPKDMAKTSMRCNSILETSKCIFNFTDGNMCRICHEDDTNAPLVSPCHCTGTMGMLHMACLETWLGSSNTTKCEICHFQFTVLKKARPIKWYMKEPSLYSERRKMLRDVALSVTLGLLVVLICVLCLVFAERLTDEGKHIGATILILVTTSTIVIYFVWIGLSVRRIYRLFGKWQAEHHVIHIKQHGIRNSVGNKLFKRFTIRPRRLSSKKAMQVPTEPPLNNTPLGSYETLESYKAAMYNSVVPPFPDLNNNNWITSPDNYQSDRVTFPGQTPPSSNFHSNTQINRITSLDRTDIYSFPGNKGSTRVPSPDHTSEEAAMLRVEYEEQSTVMYYQPPESGSTSILYNETGQLLRETGV